MKTKLLSVFLVLAMLLTSVLCLLPAAAETDYDAEAKTKGYVCRVGTAEEAAANNYSGYKTNVKDAATAALASGKTVTLINDVELTAEIAAAESGKKLVIEGNNKTLKLKNKFRAANGGNITVNNLTIETTSSWGGELVTLQANGILAFVNCTFKITTAYTNKDKIIAINSGTTGILKLNSCAFSIDKNSALAQNAGTALIATYWDSAPVVTFDHTTVDLSALPNIGLIKAGNASLKATVQIQNQSEIKTTKSFSFINTKITDSTVECTADGINLFDYNTSDAVNITATNATLIGKKYVFKFAGCQSGVNVTLDGNTVVKGPRPFSVTNNKCPVTITAKGNTTIQSSGNQAIHVVGSSSENATFALTMTDHAKLISPKDGITFNEEGKDEFAIKKATITVLDAVTIDTPNGTFLPTAAIIANGSITYIRSDRATMNVREQYTDAGKFVVNDVYSPVMEKGASIRTVEGSKGIRFTSTMKKVTDTDAVKLTATYGTLIVKAADLEGKEFTIDALTKAGVKFADIKATEAGTVAGDTETTYNAALVNLPDDQLDTNFAARAYAVYTINGVEHYVYSDFNATDNCRSMSQIASKAQADTQPTKSAAYPNEIAAGVYSPYTKSQYAVISEYVKKN